MLSDDAQVAPAAPRPPPIMLPRPRWWLRVIIIITIGVLACFGLGTVLAASAFYQITSSIENQLQTPSLIQPVALPPIEILKDAEATQTAITQHPNERNRFIIARAEVLRQAGFLREAELTCGWLPHHAPVNPTICLLRGELLLALDKPEQAHAEVSRLDGIAITEVQTQRLTTLIEQIIFKLQAQQQFIESSARQ